MEEFKYDIVKKHEMNDMGLLRYFLGMEIIQTKDEVFIS